MILTQVELAYTIQITSSQKTPNDLKICLWVVTMTSFFKVKGAVGRGVGFFFFEEKALFQNDNELYLILNDF